MEYKKFRYRVLCEDNAHFLFVQGWLEAKGVPYRAIRPIGTFPHKGSGKQYVQQKFPEELQKIRQKRGENVALVVVQDADNEACNICVRRYAFETKDPVFIIIPKWSIDTWVRFLENAEQFCDENTTYKPSHAERNKKRWKLLGKQLAKMPKDDSMPPSLQDTWERVAQKKSLLH